MTDVRIECDGVTLVCPEDMTEDVRRILQGGEYDVPCDINVPQPRVLDIGANVGAFSLWAAKRWGARVTAYEPHPRALEYLARNIRAIGGDEDGVPWIVAHARAVMGEHCPGLLRLYTGKNLGCTSTHVLDEAPDNLTDEFHDVPTVFAGDLPRAEVVKIDTEGCEVDILRYYDLSETHIVMYEWHRREDRKTLEALLEARGFTLYSQLQRSPWLGTARWVREPKETP